MDDPSGNLLSLIVLLLSAATFVTLSLLFSASESAFLALNKLRVHFLRKKGDKRAIRAGKLLDKKEELLNMLLVGNEIVNVALSVVLTSVFLKLFGPKGLGIATGISTVLLLIFGEITPKSVTTRHPEAIAFGLSGFVTFFFYLLRPLVIFFTFISRSILKIFGINTKKKNVSFTEDEIKTFIDVGGEEGVLENGEKKMMNRVFKFTDLAAVDIMIPRRRIVGIQPGAKYRDIVQLSERTRLSRFPVYREDIDDIIGVLYVKDLLYFDINSDEFDVEKMMREPLFIPGSTKMSSVQSLMYERKENFAVVIDEYSGTDGILTSEDIAREIFGGITDDFEQSGRATDVVPGAEDSFADTVLEGSCRLVDLEETLHIKLESKMNETLAGFITEQIDRMPMLGDSVEVSGYKFIVEALDGLRVSKIRCVREVSDEELDMEETEDESVV